MPDEPVLTLYYDGLCHLCSREIEHYRRIDKAHKLGYVDISADDFDAAAHGVSKELVHKVMHARYADGTWATGVDAFVAVWEQVPGYRGLAKVARTPGIHGLFAAGYAVFARIRPLLPRRKRDECARCAT